jgi:catechol 2,3-dioxygenase-like lactoylglutathione lyase family enzyme
MQIERLDHLVLTVADIARTSEFYTRVLGMEVVRFGEGRTALRFGQQKINLHPAGDIPGLVADKPTPGSGDLCFITPVPLAEVTVHLETCGIPIVAGPGPALRRHRYDPVRLYPRSGPEPDRDLELLSPARITVIVDGEVVLMSLRCRNRAGAGRVCRHRANRAPLHSLEGGFVLPVNALAVVDV